MTFILGMLTGAVLSVVGLFVWLLIEHNRGVDW